MPVSICAPSCGATELCSNSTCYSGTAYDYSAGGNGGVTVDTAQLVECIQVRVANCGVLTGVGIVTHFAVNDPFRFAVYDDESGRPANRLAQSDKVEIKGSQAQIPVAPQRPIGRCSNGESGYYWICFASAAEYVSVEITNASGTWAQGAALDHIPEYLVSGLPETDPTTGPTQSTATAALIYVLVARPN
jgi:hypothetical protein